MMKDEFLTQQSQEYQSNIHFFQNAIETFGLGELLIQIRRKQLTVRQFYPDTETKSKVITAFNIGGVPVLVGLIGIVYFLLRRADSAAYERKFI